MAQLKVAETPTSAKTKTSVKNPNSPPRLQVAVSDRAPGPGAAIHSSRAIFEFVIRELGQADREHFLVLHLDNKHRLLAKETISIGTQSSVEVHPREVFKGAVLNGSSAIVCAHNHPSGDPTPSQKDRDITFRLREAGALMGIEVFDHIIVGNARTSQYYSFCDSGTLPKTGALFSGRVEQEKPCNCKSSIFDAVEELGQIQSKIELMNCLSLDDLSDNNLAKDGYKYTLRTISKEIGRIEDQLSLAMKNKAAAL